MKYHFIALSVLFSSACGLNAADGGVHSGESCESVLSSGFIESGSCNHSHSSPRGAPIVHSFGVESAITGRDLILDYRRREGGGVELQEFEIELEWSFTPWLGVILEVPYLIEKTKGGGEIRGFGDLAIVPRGVVLERDGFILAAQIEFGLPTGGSDFEPAMSIAPGVAMWADLGNWWTLNAQLAVEHGFDEDSTELTYGFGLVKTFDCLDKTAAAGTVGLLNLHAEITGSAGLNGSEKGEINLEGLLGLSYGVAAGVDLRIAYEFPLTSPNDFDSGVVAGVLWHF